MDSGNREWDFVVQLFVAGWAREEKNNENNSALNVLIYRRNWLQELQLHSALQLQIPINY